MKKISALVAVCVLVVLTFAEEAAKKTAPGSDALTFQMADVKATAPFVLKDGAISQPAQTELAAGGKVVISFTIAQAGDYVIQAIANAPDEDSNSFFLNIDAPPDDPLMIWDIDVTKGFEERIVSWRGSGDSSSDEFVPKVFRLTAGEHKLFVVGREPAQLKTLSIRPKK
jgi:hypothetical protein